MLKIPFVKSIFIAKPIGPNPPPAGGFPLSNPMEEKTNVLVIKNKGIVGDRFFDVNCFKLNNGKTINFSKSRNISFISFENIQKLQNIYDIKEKDLRRNVVMRNLDAKLLLNKKFKIGSVLFLGVELCKSCKHIEEVTKINGISKDLFSIGGIRAQSLSSGEISVGNKICLI